MEQNLQVITKKIKSLILIIFFMLKKGISKTFLDLNLMMKRGKIVGKTLNNLLFHHHHHWAANTFFHHPRHLPFPAPSSSDEYEFSCSTTPQYPLSLFSTNKKHHAEYSPGIDMKALEMLSSANASPDLSRFGKGPMAKQLRVTDSPVPVTDGEEDGKVDEAAEKFIMRFYNDLRRQD